MKLYYVSAVIGTGLPEDPYRAAIDDVVDPATGLKAFVVNKVLATHPQGHPQFGQPIYPWCLCIVEGEKHGIVSGNPDIDALPEFSLDVKLSSMIAFTKDRMLSKLSARQIDVSALGVADGYRDLIRTLGKLHAATFSEDDFDVTS